MEKNFWISFSWSLDRFLDRTLDKSLDTYEQWNYDFSIKWLVEIKYIRNKCTDIWRIKICKPFNEPRTTVAY